MLYPHATYLLSMQITHKTQRKPVRYGDIEFDYSQAHGSLRYKQPWRGSGMVHSVKCCHISLQFFYSYLLSCTCTHRKKLYHFTWALPLIALMVVLFLLSYTCVCVSVLLVLVVIVALDLHFSLYSAYSYSH